MLRRTYWQEQIARLDPEVDYERICRIVTAHEFPWDMMQALSLALFRTYAVPSIGRLLDATGEFHRNTQKRYDDTALLLDEISLHGLHSERGRAAVRRINQMHGAYEISNEDMRYVLSTFVVIPKRWMDDYGWRPFSPAEVGATVRYYVELGRLMGIRDVPGDYAGFERLLEDYEREHFRFDRAGRRVADSTMRLMLGFYPPGTTRAVDAFSRAVMDDRLLEAFGYRRPPRLVRGAARAGLRTRARLEALLPARREPMTVEQFPRIRSYPNGYDVAALGTFPRGRCPVRHPS
jgi:hypothetical protein